MASTARVPFATPPAATRLSSRPRYPRRDPMVGAEAGASVPDVLGALLPWRGSFGLRRAVAVLALAIAMVSGPAISEAKRSKASKRAKKTLWEKRGKTAGASDKNEDPEESRAERANEARAERLRAKRARAKRLRAKRARAKRLRAKRARAKRLRAKRERARRLRAERLREEREQEARERAEEVQARRERAARLKARWARAKRRVDESSAEQGRQLEDDGAGETPTALRVQATRTSVTSGEGASRAGGAYVEMHAGVSAWARQLRFRHQEQQGVLPPRTYEGTPVGGARFAGAIYPLGKTGWRGLGLAVEYDQTIGLTSRISDQGSTYDLPTEQGRWSVGVRYGVPVWASRLEFRAGYQQIDHDIDANGMAIEVPAVHYTLLSAGAAIEYPLTDWLELGVGGSSLYVLEVGDFVSRENYGTASTRGLEAELSLELRPAARLLIGVGLELTSISFDFLGNGRLNEVDVTGARYIEAASDTYVGAFVTAGYTL